MAAPRVTPDSPATQLAKAEDGLECGPAQEEEEEEEKGEEVEIEEEEEEEIMVEEGEDKEVVEEEEEGGRAGHVDQVEVELEEDEDVEDAVAEEQSLMLGTQERLSRGSDAKSPVLQEEGKKRNWLLGATVGAWEGRRESSWARHAWSWSIRTQELLTLLAVPAEVTMKAGPSEIFSSALQAARGPATPRDEDLEDEEEEEEEEDEEEEEEEEDDDSLTAGSQVSCSLVWSSVNQGGFPERGLGTYCPRDPCWQS